MRQLPVFVMLTYILLTGSIWIQAQEGYAELYIQDSITRVQPMTGIVFWHNSSYNQSDAISLEFSYMLFNEVVTDSGVYDWTPVEAKLNAIASRNHQAIFRFRYVYPGYETSVPDYIKAQADYEETVGLSEGRETHFPDWTNAELQRFTLDFYTRFAERYDNDPRLAFIQVGFGLWGEYHIYSGPFTLGETFPSKAFQEQFFRHLETTFSNIPWSISIDAADDTYSPFATNPSLLEISFGLFDDSFMHSSHAGYNTTSWNFFDRDRYRRSPAGGEFSYYSDYDQAHVLDYPDGPYGEPYEHFARDFHISYMIGNDQPRYQTMERIWAASMASGYKFKIVSLKTKPGSTLVEILNYGVAPIYYDAFPALDGVRSGRTLKYHAPGDTIEYEIAAFAEGAELTIESDKLLKGQTIQFHGTNPLPETGITSLKQAKGFRIYPNPAAADRLNILSFEDGYSDWHCSIYDITGALVHEQQNSDPHATIYLSDFTQGIYLVRVTRGEMIFTDQFIRL